MKKGRRKTRKGRFEKEKKRKGAKIKEMGNGVNNVGKSSKHSVKRPHGFTT